MGDELIDTEYVIKHCFPANKEFTKLFNSVGWKRDSSRIDLIRKNTCFAASIYKQNKIVGMGRVVGDGCYFTIYDIVVDKKHQGLGIGTLILKEIIAWYKKIKDDDTFLYCGASKDREKFYEKFGFISRPNADVGAGMKWYDE